MRAVQLLGAQTTTGPGAPIEMIRLASESGISRGKMTFQAKGSTSASTGAASIAVQVSNDGTNWLTLGTISLSLSTTETSDGFSSDAPWAFVRGNVLSISGTGAAVSLLMGV